MSDWRSAVHYRNRAEVLRAIADELDRADHKETLTRVAMQLDEIADRLEREARKPTA